MKNDQEKIMGFPKKRRGRPPKKRLDHPPKKRLGRPPKNMEKHPLPKAGAFESVIRTGGRVKKEKKVFDPSENNPQKNSVIIQNTIDLERPKNNHSTEVNNSLQIKVRESCYQKKDDFCSFCSIQCQDCNLKVHFSCININYQNNKLLETKWRCDNCKSCATCNESNETGPLITCATCVKSFHYNCHVPNIYDENNLNWMCTKCSPKLTQFKLKKAIVRLSPYTYPKLAKDVAVSTNKSSSKLEKNKNINLPNNDNAHNIVLQKDDTISLADNEYEQIPDVSKWSCDQLASFIKKYFPAEAQVLKEQEIDGASLLLMTRSDVIFGLKLNKLGSAIRLFNFITILQKKLINLTKCKILELTVK